MARVPLATYRLQFNRQFTFEQAAEIAGYLRDLGISDVYCSPLFQAGPESTHGYDISCFGELNDMLGGQAGFEKFAGRLHDLGLGLLLDVVPNHMSTDLGNSWWRDILAKGPASAYANWLDIDWTAPWPNMQGKVLVPVLEDHYANVLEAGKLKLQWEDNEWSIGYYGRRFPLAPASLKQLDSVKAGAVNGKPGEPDSFDCLDTVLRQQHYRLAYWQVAAEKINYRRFFDVTELVSVRMELPEVFAAAHKLVFELIAEGKVTGLRIDHPDGLWNPTEYFERLQNAIRKLPAGTASQAREQPFYIVAEKILTGDEQLPPEWPVAGTTGYEFLNRVNGLFVNAGAGKVFTEIYREFTKGQNDLDAVVYSSKKHVLANSFGSELEALTGRLQSIAAGTRCGLDFTAGAIRDALVEIIARFPVYRIYVTDRQAEARVEEPTEQPLTENSPGSGPLSGSDRHYILQAVKHASASGNSTLPYRSRPIDGRVLAFLQDILLLKFPADMNERTRADCRNFVLKFQQLTGPVMAKGLEDTAFYRFNRLVSLNEVGGDPDRFGVEPGAFHSFNQRQARHWPHTLLASATHDTKRGEDVRARINVLSEMPDEWHAALCRWSKLNVGKKSTVQGQIAPDANDEYLLYQTLLGAWIPEAETIDGLPAFRERIQAYMLKAIREAKAHTSWTYPDSGYEQAMTRFIEALLSDLSANEFLAGFKPLQRKMAFVGRFNSLSQTLLKITATGVPDFYQGTELWDFSLVDPDNRRRVDFSLRRRMLAELQKTLPEDTGVRRDYLESLVRQPESGKMKLYLIWRALEFRKRHAELFKNGNYDALQASGTKREHICAFARTHNGDTAIIVVPRLILGLTGGLERPPHGREVWEETVLELTSQVSSTCFRNVFTGELLEMRGTHLRLSKILAHFPVALLEPVRDVT